MFKRLIAVIVMLILPITANAKLKDKDVRETQEMRGEVLAQLYENNPEAQALIGSSEGYAVFNNGGINLVFLSAGSGKGVVHDNRSGADTYMRMATGGVGIGLGIKDYRTVIIFHKRAMFDQFVDKGWDLSGQADAAAKVGDNGGEANATDSVVSGLTVYNMTKKGLALQATIQGTKYWKWD
jgi:lipid-binding SYLF domain-containing protein